jgi:hypothetical protein
LQQECDYLVSLVFPVSVCLPLQKFATLCRF